MNKLNIVIENLIMTILGAVLLIFSYYIKSENVANVIMIVADILLIISSIRATSIESKYKVIKILEYITAGMLFILMILTLLKLTK